MSGQWGVTGHSVCVVTRSLYSLGIKDAICSGPLLGAERDLSSSQWLMQPLQQYIITCIKCLTVKMPTSLSSICRVWISKRHRSDGCCVTGPDGRWNSKSIVVLLSSWTRSPWALRHSWRRLWTSSLRAVVSSLLFAQIPVPCFSSCPSNCRVLDEAS